MIQNIVMICVGNICRSPMAEALLRARLAKIAPEIYVHSAGLSALVNHPADNMAQEVMLENAHLDISAHRAKQVTMKILSEADLILVMESSHQKQIQYNYSSVYGKVHCLGKWNDYDIPDPYRQPKQVFLQTFQLIDKAISQWQARLWK